MKKINIVISLTIIFLIIYLVIVFFINKYKIKEYTYLYNYLDTYINITIYSRNDANKILKDIDEIYKEYDILTSNKEVKNYKNLYYLNQNNEFDERLYDILKIGLDYYKKSEGIININMGCVYDLYNDNIISLDDMKLCNTAIENIKLVNNNIEGEHNISLDNIKLSYVNNKIKNYLYENGYDSFIINSTGNVIVGKKNYDTSLFNVGIQYDNSANIIDVVSLNDKSIVSKGKYNGIKSIVSSKTNMVENNYKSVSVISNDNMLSNFLANILYFKSIEEGKKILKNYDAEALWIDNQKNMYYTDGYLKYRI